MPRAPRNHDPALVCVRVGTYVHANVYLSGRTMSKRWATGKKNLPSHIWYQKKRNYIAYKMVKSPLRSSLGKLFY